jgi:hypothetical protein
MIAGSLGFTGHALGVWGKLGPRGEGGFHPFPPDHTAPVHLNGSPLQSAHTAPHLATCAAICPGDARESSAPVSTCDGPKRPEGGGVLPQRSPQTDCLLRLFFATCRVGLHPFRLPARFSAGQSDSRESLARQMLFWADRRGPRSPPHRHFEVGPPIIPVVRSLAPDPYGQDRVLLSGQRPHFFLFLSVMPGFSAGDS